MAKKTREPQGAYDTMEEARAHQDAQAVGSVDGVDEETARLAEEDEDGWIDDDEDGWEIVNSGEPLLFCVAPTVDANGYPLAGQPKTIQGLYHRIHHRTMPKDETILDHGVQRKVTKIENVYSFELELTKPALVRSKKINNGIPFTAPAGKRVRITVTKALKDHAMDVLEPNVQELRIQYVRREPLARDPMQKFWVLKTQRRDSGKPHVGAYFATSADVDLLALAEGRMGKRAVVVEPEAETPALGAGGQDAPKAIPATVGASASATNDTAGVDAQSAA
jgi:hypothetical protein